MESFDYTYRTGRPSREYLHMKMAVEWSRRSLCSQPNRQVGAVITSFDLRRVLSFGYNGPGRDMPDNYCATWRHEHTDPAKRTSIQPDGSTALLSKCPCLHAEDNAISFVDSTIANKRLFCTMQPCLVCAQRIMNANIRHVYFIQEYRDQEGILALNRAKIDVYRFDLTGRFSRVM